MRLLFDHNLSPRLVERLANLYPQAEHVYRLGLDRAPDEVVWRYAREHEYTIVTRDADYNEFSVVRGFPPKVIWIRTGNCTTRRIEALLRAHAEAIEALDADPGIGVLTLL